MIVEKRNPLFDERQVEVEVSGLRACVRFDVDRGSSIAQECRHIGVHHPKILQLHIRRVADDGVKAALAALRKDFRERRLPIKGIHTLSFCLVIKREVYLALEESGPIRLLPSRMFSSSEDRGLSPRAVCSHSASRVISTEAGLMSTP